MSYKKVKLNHISRKALEIGHLYQYPVFYQDIGNIYKVLIEKDSSFVKETQETIDKLQLKDLYILTKDHFLYEKDTQEYISKIIDDTSISSKLKSEIIHDMASDTINELLTGEINRSKIERTTELVNDTIQLILNDDSAAKAMLGVTSYDYYTYTHCVNVSIYALGFGAHLKLNQKKLNILGRAGILHDLGKKNIPNSIVNKNGKLTDEEFETMKNHPEYAVDILRELGETDQLVLTAIEQHHEKLDGSGYPKGLKANEIHILSQIIAIADIFDALTTKRSYKDALKTFDALSIMKNEMENELNSHLLAEFMIFMGNRIDRHKSN
jgi:putative nucleotidyltransferase with HDIG domain